IAIYKRPTNADTCLFRFYGIVSNASFRIGQSLTAIGQMDGKIPDKVEVNFPTFALSFDKITMPISKEVFVPSFCMAIISSTTNSTVLRPFSTVSENVVRETKFTKPINVFEILKQHYKLYGLFGFWKNHLLYVQKFGAAESLNLAFREEYKRLIPLTEETTQVARMWISRNALIGLASGATTALITHPFTSASIRLEFDKHVAGTYAREFNGLTDCMIKTFKKNAFVGLYRGFLLGLQEAAVFRAAYFGLYDSMKHLYCNGKSCVNIPILWKFLMAQTSAMIGAAVCLPSSMDFIRFMQSYMAKESSVSVVAIRAKMERPNIELRLIRKMAYKRVLVANLLMSVACAATLVVFEELVQFKDEFSRFTIY
ncbi:ADP:ATP carrier protein-like protein, partial [Leptotrombidium deliense]